MIDSSKALFLLHPTSSVIHTFINTCTTLYAGAYLDLGHAFRQPQSLDSQPCPIGPQPKLSFPLLGGRQNGFSYYLNLNH